MFDDLNQEICGCASNNKKSKTAHILRISLWIRSSDKPDVIQRIGKKLKLLLNLENSDKLKFYVHAEVESQGVYKSSPKYEL